MTTATRDLYCVMGHPVAHSRSPWIHQRFAALTDQALDYERQLVPLDGFAQAVQQFAQAGGRGCNVTVPFKTEAPGLATECSERVQLAGAANTLTFRADGSIYPACDCPVFKTVGDGLRRSGDERDPGGVYPVGAGDY